MNKKIIIGVAIIIAGIAIVEAKAMFGDTKTELPMEEQIENILNLEESNDDSEYGESQERENRENESNDDSESGELPGQENRE